jgi:hypothetical protein
MLIGREECARQLREAWSRIAELEAERDRQRAALLQIREQSGRVCENFELCTHESCRSSYAAWSLADEAIRRERHNDG